VLRYAQFPINNDATGDSVVLSLLWPQSSPETINSTPPDRSGVDRIRGGGSPFDRFHRCIYIFYTDSRKDKVLTYKTPPRNLGGR
jgi:hypothetical protein